MSPARGPSNSNRDRLTRAGLAVLAAGLLIMAGAMMALLPPVAVILFMQRWFVKGLVESEK
jgi:ABC-type glycerol-3-phosphate transport system permease component